MTTSARPVAEVGEVEPGPLGDRVAGRVGDQRLERPLLVLPERDQPGQSMAHRNVFLAPVS